MKRLVAVGVAFVLMVSAGMTVEARHHVSCMGRMLQSTALCQPTACSNGEHHFYWHEDGQDCGFWGVDVDGICDGWAHCEYGYGAGTTDSTPVEQMEEIPSQPQAENQVPTATAPYDDQTYNSDTNQNQTAGYGNGGHHEDWHHSSGGYGAGHHGSRHHGHH